MDRRRGRSFVTSFRAPVGDQLLRQPRERREMRETPTQAFDDRLPFLEHQPGILDGGEQGVAGADPQLLPEKRRNHQAALRTDGNGVLVSGLWHGQPSVPQMS